MQAPPLFTCRRIHRPFLRQRRRTQPLDVLTQRLAEQVSSSAIVQDRVRERGALLGPDLDRALGGALTQVDNSTADDNREANQGVELLDGMDTQVAAQQLGAQLPHPWTPLDSIRCLSSRLE